MNKFKTVIDFGSKNLRLGVFDQNQIIFIVLLKKLIII